MQNKCGHLLSFHILGDHLFASLTCSIAVQVDSEG